MLWCSLLWELLAIRQTQAVAAISPSLIYRNTLLKHAHTPTEPPSGVRALIFLMPRPAWGFACTVSCKIHSNIGEPTFRIDTRER